ncbi:hypothetical protein KCU85_g6526, partial [Aureobasidium melanogenum]
MSSDSELSGTAPPSDAILEKTLRDIVRKAEVDPITVKRVRTAAEERLGLDAGFFKSHDEWNEKSKEIIEDAFNQPSQKSPSPEPTPPKKAPSQAKTTKRTSTSKAKPAPKRQKRAVSEPEAESEHSDFESEEESKPKSKPAQKKSQTVDSDEEDKQEDNQDAEIQEEEVVADHDSESEMSVVLDEAPPKRKKSTSAGPKTKAQPKAKVAKAAAKPSELSEEEQTIKRLQGELVKCGVRKLWHRELASYDTSKAKIGHLKQMLKDVGMTGRFSEQKAKAIKERRELEADLEAVQEGAKQWGNEKDSGEDDSEAEDAPRPQRRAAANRFVDFGDDDDDDDDE